MPDADVLQSVVVATIAFAATAGLLWVGYFVWAWQIAARASTRSTAARSLLLFGKKLVDGQADPDYLSRIHRTYENAKASPSARIVLLGGANAGDGASESAVALLELRRLGMPDGIEVLIDDASLDTLENLRHARRLLGPHARLPVTLISSRYHLPRCAFLARRLGFEFELCAAEDTFTATVPQLRRLALEAGYLLWIDVGTRWAKLTGQRRVTAQIS